ncbi:glycosyltransferase [Gemmobacter straminiformis]|uniref:Glycosyltransferase n=1 Tax=Paragemmobacter straminiformis TaxID=2045119 RepID=A0A842I5L8_9RHOB|nr:glycosyltransferase [Gemmobacter straminiformis]
MTIVVSIRNAAVDLSKTLDNFALQTFVNFEVLIADCNSTDDPAQYVTARPYPIVHIVQTDYGIYDAWNRVLPQARGRWVIFMGAGDTFKCPNTLQDAAEFLSRLPDNVLMAYGRVDVLGENGNLMYDCGAPWSQALNHIRRFELFPHQATFQRTDTFTRFGLFDAQYRIAGDRDMILRLAAVFEPVFFPQTVANFRYGGTSSVPEKRLMSIFEMSAVMAKHNIKPKSSFPLIKATVLNLLTYVLPESVLYRMVDAYRIATGRKRRYQPRKSAEDMQDL